MTNFRKIHEPPGVTYHCTHPLKNRHKWQNLQNMHNFEGDQAYLLFTIVSLCGKLYKLKIILNKSIFNKKKSHQ